MNSRIGLLLRVTALVGLLGLAIWTSRAWASHSWRRVWGARVTTGDKSLPAIRVFASKEGNYLIVDPEDVVYYVVVPQERHVGMPNGSAFVVTPLCAWSKEALPPLANMAKGDVQEDVSVELRKLAFTAMGPRRLVVSM